MVNTSFRPSTKAGSAALLGWTPVQIALHGAAPAVHWRHLGELRLTDPFFEDVLRRLGTPDPACCRLSSLEDLLGVVDRFPARCPAPAGLVFHVSRCGSTTVSNLLAASRRNVLVSEAVPINQVLGASEDRFGAPGRLATLRACVRALCQRRFRFERRGFVKLASWNIVHAADVRRAFPEAPTMVVYRDPLEVAVSNLRTPSSWMLARSSPMHAAIMTGLDERTIGRLSVEEYCAQVVGQLLRAAVACARSGPVEIVSYEEIDERFIERLASFFSLPCTDKERTAMRASLRVYSKDPSRTRPFVDDRSDKRRDASASLKSLVRRYAQEPFEQLEQLRSVGAR